MCYEMLIVTVMIKPAIDAMRVANGDAQPENSIFDPTTELKCTKVLEMFSESIPSSVLQMYALLGPNGEASNSAVFSIVVSAM